MLILLFFSQIPKPVPVKLWGNSVMLLYITAYCQGCCSNYILCILIITLSLKETMDSALQNLSNACSLINSIDPKAGAGGDIKQKMRLNMIQKTGDWNPHPQMKSILVK